ncbi:MAG: hypothetical protein AAB482_02905 [Patescibacteria group bacterium]
MRHIDGNDFKQKNGYEVNGVWLPRVTRILEVKAKPALQAFFFEMGSAEAADAVKNKSAEHGTLVHEAVQRAVIGEVADIPAEVRPAVEAFLEFNKERNIQFHPEYIEKQVWSARHRYAGTVDGLASIDGKFGVLDIKTSTGFYPEYNLQTAAYIEALREYDVKLAMNLPREVETRWILRIDQHKICKKCKSIHREKGGRIKVRSSRLKSNPSCEDGEHEWGEVVGDVELREFPYFYYDVKAFLAAKTLWEWENNYWLRQIGYSR